MVFLLITKNTAEQQYLWTINFRHIKKYVFYLLRVGGLLDLDAGDPILDSLESPLAGRAPNLLGLEPSLGERPAYHPVGLSSLLLEPPNPPDERHP